jgi:hypothetical protein
MQLQDLLIVYVLFSMALFIPRIDINALSNLYPILATSQLP